MRRFLKKLMSGLLAIAMVLPTFVGGAPVKGAETKAARTFLLYVCGTDNETNGGSVSKQLTRMMDTPIPEDVNVIVLTGGTRKWHFDKSRLEGAKKVSAEYNQVWKMTGKNGNKNGRLTLIEAKGIEGANHLPMTDPVMLKAFLNYCAAHYPAEKYDLMMLDHGLGPVGGFCIDEVVQRTDGKRTMSVAEIAGTLAESDIGHFDIVDFYACLMGSVEMAMSLSTVTDYIIFSPHPLPGWGEDLNGFLEMLSSDSRIGGRELGKRIVDDTIAFYSKNETDEATMTLVDTKNLLKRLAPKLTQVAELMMKEATTKGSKNNSYNYYDELFSFDSAITYGSEQNSKFYDLGNLIESLGISVNEIDNCEDVASLKNAYTTLSTEITSIMSDCDDNGDDVLYAKNTDSIRKNSTTGYRRDADGTLRPREDDMVRGTGLSIYFDKVNGTNSIDYMEAVDDMLAVPGLDAEASRFLKCYRDVVGLYALIRAAGNTVALLREGGMAEIIDDAVKKAWQEQESFTLSPTTHERTSGTVWDLMAKTLYEKFVSGNAEKEAWFSELIRQQSAEAITSDDITVVEESGNYKLSIKAPLRSIGHIGMRLESGLEVTEQDVGAYYKNKINSAVIELSDNALSGNIDASSLLDEIDKTGDALQSIIELYKKDTSEFVVPDYDEKWYAVSGGKGRTYAARCHTYPGGNGVVLLPARISLKVGGFLSGALRVKINKNGKGTVTGFVPGADMDNRYDSAGDDTTDPSGQQSLADLASIAENINLRALLTENDISQYYDISCRFNLDGTPTGGLKVERLNLWDIDSIAKTADGNPKTRYKYYIRDFYGHETDLSGLIKNEKKVNKIALKKAGKTYSVSVLKRGKKSFKIKASAKKGKLRFETAKKAKKAGIRVTKTGNVTLPKGLKKGTYQILLRSEVSRSYKATHKAVKVTVK